MTAPLQEGRRERSPIPDLDRCAQEQVQVIGQIQPHGLLFALSEPGLIVRQVSANISTILGLPPESVLDRSFEAVLGAQLFEAFQTQRLSDAGLGATPFRLPARGDSVAMQCIAHRHDGLLIVEFECVEGAHSLDTLDFESHIRLPLSRMRAESDISELSQVAAGEVRKLSGFDRVMVYRFDKDWNGEVIAEAVGPSSVSYFGMRFPAGDIPPQVRQLFLANVIRAIADIDAMPAPIVPTMNPFTGKSLDLTHSALRAASPIHLEYLRNMGVQSSLTVSIIVEGRLWGMIACHHPKARRLAHSARSVCKFVGEFLAAQVALRAENAALHSRLEARLKLDDVVVGLETGNSLIQAVQFEGARLLELFDADGFVSSIDGVVSSHGVTIEQELLLPVIGELRKLASRGVASSDDLGKLDPEIAAHASLVSGGLYIDIAKRGQAGKGGNNLLFLRRELVETISWAGNPNKAVAVDPHDRLHPRKTFEAWRQAVHGSSRPWTEIELETGSRLCEQMLRLQEIATRIQAEQLVHQSEERFRMIFEHAPSGMGMSGLEGGFTRVNAAFCSMLGYSMDELQTIPWRDLTFPEDVVVSQEMTERLLREPGVPVEAEKRYLHKNGSVIWAHIGMSLATNSDGVPLYFVAHVQDITARKRAEEALRESEERFRTMADACPSMLVVTGAKGEMEFINRVCRSFLGVTIEQLQLGDWRLLIHPDDLPQFSALFDRAVTEHATFRAEVRLRRADGEWRLVGSNAEPRLSPSGKYMGHIGLCADITERKRAEEALRSSEENFRELAENISNVFWIVSPATGEVVYVSPAYEEIWGRSIESLYRNPLSWVNAIHPDDRERTHLLSARQLAGERTIEEYRIRTPDGTEKWVRVRSSPVHDQAGKLIRIVGISEEITERKRAEELLKQTAERLELAARAGSVGIWDLGIPNSALVWDEQMFGLYGTTKDRFGGTHEAWQELLHPEDRGRAVEEMRAAVRGEKQFDTEFRVIWEDGSIHHLRANALVKWDASGKPIRIVGTNWDMTAQKQAKELLRKTAERLALAASSGGAGIWDLDYVDGGVHWDERMFRIYGITEDKFGGNYEAWLALIHPEDRSRADEELTAALRGEKEFDCQFRVVWPDGSIHHLRANALVKWDALGKPIQIVGTNRDVTSQKEAASALLESNRHLQLETERARESSLAADAANAAKSEVLANMSHEIRTPMNGVIGMTGLLLDTELTPEQRRYAEKARASGESLLRLINDILDFSKIEAKKLELETVNFDLRILLDNLASILSATATAKGIELLCAADPAVPTQLRGDPGRLRQILTNLTANAIKFTEKGEVVVGVALVEETESNCLLRFSVRDTGIGIPEDKVGTLFHKFSQVDVSTTRKYGGTGLGLAISKQLAELMGGGVGVTSEQGKGSEFWFTVRLGRSLGLDEPAEREQPESHATSRLNGKILIADDNSTNRELAVGLLRKLGLRADAVADGAEALHALESIPYDLVLMDMRMPVMDGIEAARQIRNPRSAVLNHDIPIIALTANAMQSDRDSCMASGMNDFVPKPIVTTALRDALKRWLPSPDAESDTGPVAVPDAETAGREQLRDARTGQAEATVFDRAGVLSRLEEDEELAQIVFDEFLKDIPGQIQVLKYLVKGGDAAGSARLAHSIRGASANVGGECLRNLACEMEVAADAGNLQLVADSMAELEYQFNRLQDAMRGAKAKPSTA